MGEQSLYKEIGKIFKPITEQQQKSSEEIVSKFAPFQEAIENMPAWQALPWEPEPRGAEPFLPSKIGEQPEALPEPYDGPMNVGLIASKYLPKATSKKSGTKILRQKETTKEICSSVMQNYN